MPFKSKAQRAWMHIHDPEMASRWEKHTPKGKKLPKHVKEEDDSESNGHEGFEVQDFRQDLDPLNLRSETYAELYTKLENQLAAECGEDPVNEMPHIDADIDVQGKRAHMIDLKIEKYPIPKQERQRLMRAFDRTGVVGELGGEFFHFTHDGAESVDPSLTKQIARLPVGWEKIADFISETKENGNTGEIPENPHLPDPEEEGQEFKKVGVTHAVQIDEPFVVKTIENDEAEAKAGDFLCKGPKGDMWPVDQDVFYQTYRPIDAPKMEKVFKRK